MQFRSHSNRHDHRLRWLRWKRYAVTTSGVAGSPNYCSGNNNTISGGSAGQGGQGGLSSGNPGSAGSGGVLGACN